MKSLIPLVVMFLEVNFIYNILIRYTALTHELFHMLYEQTLIREDEYPLKGKYLIFVKAKNTKIIDQKKTIIIKVSEEFTNLVPSFSKYSHGIFITSRSYIGISKYKMRLIFSAGIFIQTMISNVFFIVVVCI
jgi:hypothetical protein